MSGEQLISLDLETTGLDERVHEAWEVAYVREDGTEECWQFPVTAGAEDRASEQALQISGFRERYAVEHGLAWQPIRGTRLRPDWAAVRIAADLNGAVLLGCAIAFDMRFLAALLRHYGAEPVWHHRGLDLGSYAAGRLGRPLPLSSAHMQAEFVPNDKAHTALGDARWNWEVYRKVNECT